MTDNAPSPILSRRMMIEKLGGSFGAVGLAGMLSGTAPSSAAAATGTISIGTHFAPRAKRIIQLFMNGGPFQADLLDPKPALQKYAGQRPKGATLRTERVTGGLLPSPFDFEHCGKSGVEVSSLLPHFKKCIDEVCVLRAVHSNNPNHNPAMFLMNNGTIAPTAPSMGSWLSYGLGSENQNLPGFVVLCPGKPVEAPLVWSSAFLPRKHQGTHINHSDLDPQKMVPYLRNAKLDRTSQRRQLDLVKRLNDEHLAERGKDDALSARIEAMETAFRMQFEASEAFDVNREPAHTRERYGCGKNHFANGCLLARRLVERGVRYTQLYYGDGQPWDTHDNHNKRVRQLCSDIDRPMAALIMDLKERGLLDETLILWGGEFGRTPVSENGNGRDHNHWGFTMWMAGGGIRGGMTYGQSDDFGFSAVQDKVHIHDLHATILHVLGIDHERLTYRYAGRDFRLTDVYGRVVKEILT
ncbi:MAG: DUF1501 domain-containing protein [Planctomycetes bacterium]|nr:DUF1501 domain-containing protein [Planctomycetota bacterium]